MTSAVELEAALQGRAPGEAVTLIYLQTGVRKTTRATLDADPGLEMVTFEQAGRAVSPEVRAFREGWAASKVR